MMSPCDRCGLTPATHRWRPLPETAKRDFGELGLCDRCVEALRSFVAQGKNRNKQAKLKKGPS